MAGTRTIIVHFRPILSTSRGTAIVPTAAPTGNTDAITFIAKSSNWLLSISTHGALQPRPHPNENPPMQAARKKERSSLTANTTTRIYVTRMAICSPRRVRNDGRSLSRGVLEILPPPCPLSDVFFSHRMFIMVLRRHLIIPTCSPMCPPRFLPAIRRRHRHCRRDGAIAQSLTLWLSTSCTSFDAP